MVRERNNQTMEELQRIKQLCDMNSKFKDIEKTSESCVLTPAQHYLVVRLDGIGLSKKYLKNEVVNKRFQKVMTKAIQQTYYVLHRKSRSNAQQLFLGVVVASDEVSFILNTYGNYFDDRLFKTVTTIASTFSSFFTKEGIHENLNLSITGSFDGKPLILQNLEEVNKYIAYRAAIYTRNSMAKVLRLNGVPESELYSERNHNNLDYYQMKFKQLGLNMDGINGGCMVFVPSCKDDKKLRKFKSKSFDTLITLYSSSIETFDDWLHEVNNKKAS